MERLVVSALYITLGSLLLLDGVLLSLQARLDVLWEHGFYGARSFPTTIRMVEAGVGLFFGPIIGLAGLGYWRDRRMGRPLLFIALIVLFLLPGLAWGIVAASFLVVIDQYRYARSLRRESDD